MTFETVGVALIRNYYYVCILKYKIANMNKEIPLNHNFKTSDLDKICVYEHYFDNEEKPFYIGQGKLNRPFNFITRNKRWLDKVGDKINLVKVKIVAIDISYEKSIEIEKELIAKYGRIDIGTGCLTNENDGGLNSQTGECNYFYGRQLSGTLNGNYGNKYSKNKLSIPVIQLDVLGNFIKEWSSAREAEESGYGFISSSITACCKHKRYIHCGYQWIYKNEYDNSKNYEYKPSGRQRKVFIAFPVGHYGDLNNMIVMYGSNDIEKVHGFSTTKISLVIKGERKSHKGYVFIDVFNLPIEEKIKYIPYIDVAKI